MKKLYSSRKIEVRESSIHGYGVFVTDPIFNAELIEECYVIGSIPYKIKKDVYNFSDYQLEWNNDMAVIALGYGAIYNHSIEPNCYWEPDYEENIIRFIAIKDIDIGEEILYNYGRVLNELYKHKS